MSLGTTIREKSKKHDLWVRRENYTSDYTSQILQKGHKQEIIVERYKRQERKKDVEDNKLQL